MEYVHAVILGMHVVFDSWSKNYLVFIYQFKYSRSLKILKRSPELEHTVVESESPTNL